MRAYVFVDAENHFLRSQAGAVDVIGSPRAAEALSKADTRIHAIQGFPNSIDGRRFGWNPGLQLFWDCELLSNGGTMSELPVNIARAVYACSCTGDDDRVHSVRVQLRGYGFEPIVVREKKELNAQRGTTLRQHGIIEKPKGCDIAVATRMVADAAANLYDCCLLFTSDADFLPAIEAVRRMGKIVWVFGYESALPKRSPYLYAPDRFIDLGQKIKLAWGNRRLEIKKALEALGESGAFNES